MISRAFTLYELVVALSLVLLLGAVVVPIGYSWSRSAQFDEARMQVETALTTARSDAQRDGRPVRVEVRPDHATGEWQVVLIPMLGLPEQSSDPTALTESFESEGAQDEPTLSPAPHVTLPRSVAVSKTVPQTVERTGNAADNERASTDATPRSADPTSPEVGVDAGLALQPIALATFMPDGEALRCSPCVLTNMQGRSVRITIDAWTGQVKVERIEKGEKPDRAAAP